MNTVQAVAESHRPHKSKSSTQEWAIKKQNKVITDDGTQTFFWRAHTITVLIILIIVLVYESLFTQQVQDQTLNTKRGLIACASFFVLFGVTQTPDGPFIRPHPALWRLVLCVSVLYEIIMIYILFQTADDARRLLKYVDPTLGVKLEEQDYGGNCLIYDPDVPSDPFHNFWDKMDGFVTTHFIGWWLKTLILRDYWLCNVMSIGFEFLEYSLEHQLPNFNECWWDHWILDFLVCNGLGIYLGMKTCEYFRMKPYQWRGLWNTPSFKGKVKRVFTQFSPYNWVEFDWRPTESLKRLFFMVGVITMFFLAELSTFYLKYVLWVPPPNYLCLGRLVFIWLVGAVAMRESFEYMDNPECKRMGTQTWVAITIIFTELLIVCKFDWETVTIPPPRHITIIWTAGACIFVTWIIWQFYLKPHLNNHYEKKRKSKKSE